MDRPAVLASLLSGLVALLLVELAYLGHQEQERAAAQFGVEHDAAPRGEDGREMSR